MGSGGAGSMANRRIRMQGALYRSAGRAPAYSKKRMRHPTAA